jgi:tetratricopeptide (TPR) repeat protein
LSREDHARTQQRQKRVRQIKILLGSVSAVAAVTVGMPYLQQSASGLGEALQPVNPAQAAHTQPEQNTLLVARTEIKDSTSTINTEQASAPTPQTTATPEPAQQVAQRLPEGYAADRKKHIAFVKQGNIARAKGDSASAQSNYQKSWDITKRVAQQNSTNTIALRDANMSLIKLGRVLAETGDLNTAYNYFKASLEVSRRLVQGNTASLRAQRDLSISLENLGDVLVQMGKPENAHAYYLENLTIREHLVQSGSQGTQDLQVQRDLWASMWRVASVRGGAVSWGDVLTKLEAMQLAGVLSASDHKYLVDARHRANRAS